jgi:diguanylate cyclase (GGDEF)-like protein
MKISFLSRTRLITVLTVILISTFTFTSVLSYNVTKESLTQNAKNETLPLISDNIYSEIQQILIKPINNSSLMANDEFLIDWVQSGEEDPNEVVRYLKRIREKYGYFSSFFVSDITNNYYYYDGILKKISPEDLHDDWYFEFIGKNTDFELDVDTDEATQGTITIFINHRLEDHKGIFLGVTGVGLEMDSVGKTLELYQKKYNHLVYMIDSDGLIQVHPDPSLVLHQNIKDMDGIGEISGELLSKKEGTNIYEYKNKQGDIVISARYFPDLQWYLIVEQDQNLSLSTARNYLIGNIVIGLLVTLLVILLVIWTLNFYYKRLELLAINDDLTGLFNRRKFQEIFQHEISYARRYDQPLSLLMIDIDRFKSVNDTYGHSFGDQFLKLVAEALQGQIRDIDVIARWGGEEFVILLQRTDADQALITAERLRETIQALQYKIENETISRTISIGVVSSPSGQLDMDKMLDLADKAMYQAKENGRNRSCLVKPD